MHEPDPARPRPDTGSPVASVVALAEASALVTVLDGDREQRWLRAHRLAAELARRLTIEGVVATFDSVLVEYDPLDCTVDDVRATVRAIEREADDHEVGARGRAAELTPARRVRVPVVYGGQFGPDLDRLAASLGLTAAELARRHRERPAIIRCVVSPAGAPMTDGPDLPVPVPRLRAPRAAVPAGSVGLAGRQAMIYPAASPGGWQLIGRTPLRLLDPSADPPIRYRPGDRLEFVAVPASEWAALADSPPELVDE